MKTGRSIEKWIRLSLCTLLLTISCNLFSHLPESKDTPTKDVDQLEQTAESENPNETAGAPEGTEESPVPLSQGPLFAVFEESPGEVTAILQHEKIAQDFSNVRNPFLLSKSLIEHLVKDGFVVSNGVDKEFFSLYEKARYDNEPIFVTSDSLLHSYHLMFDKTLRVAEESHFIPLLRDLNQALLQNSLKTYDQFKDTDWRDAAMRNVAYFSVASRLLDAGVEIPDYVKEIVETELAQIDAAEGIKPSAVFPGLENGEDFTQYIPRGHYTRSDGLRAYFKSMMWYGRMTFRLKGADPAIGKEETRSAILLVNMLRNTEVNGQPALQAWADLYAPTVFFVGRSDDLTVIQYGDVFDFVYGNNPSTDALD